MKSIINIVWQKFGRQAGIFNGAKAENGIDMFYFFEFSF